VPKVPWLSITGESQLMWGLPFCSLVPVGWLYGCPSHSFAVHVRRPDVQSPLVSQVYSRRLLLGLYPGWQGESQAPFDPSSGSPKHPVDDATGRHFVAI
jgi:hypothetical protein